MPNNTPLRDDSIVAASVPPVPMPTFDALSPFSRRIEQLSSSAPMSGRTKGNLERALLCIDRDRHQQFLALHRDRLTNLQTFGPAKYADLAYWAHRSVLIAEWLDLDDRPPLNILDIGMGSGSFAMVAQSMGHRVLGTDIDNDWYDELCSLAGVERVVAPVEPRKPYCPTALRFDLITIMLPVFHRRRVQGRREYWPVEVWHEFLSGLHRDLLKPGGSIVILMPPDIHDDGTSTYSPLLEWTRARGATLARPMLSQPTLTFITIATPQALAETAESVATD